MVIGGFDIGPRPATLTPKEEIVGVTVQYMEVGLKISTTLPCSMLEKVLMLLVEVYLFLVPSLFTPTIQVIMVDHLIFIVMLITEVGLGLTPANLLHINMVG